MYQPDPFLHLIAAYAMLVAISILSIELLYRSARFYKGAVAAYQRASEFHDSAGIMLAQAKALHEECASLNRQARILYDPLI